MVGAMKAGAVFGLAALSLFTFTAGSVHNEGGIGDLRWSVLAPEEFRTLYGKGWVLMAPGQDGKPIDLRDTQLSEMSGLTEVPDARGLFLRAMNLERADDRGDPEGAKRRVGDYQEDAVGPHRHDYSRAAVKGNAQSGPGQHPVVLRTHKPGWTGKLMKGRVGLETRPRNLSAYLYLRIK